MEKVSFKEFNGLLFLILSFAFPTYCDARKYKEYKFRREENSSEK